MGFYNYFKRWCSNLNSDKAMLQRLFDLPESVFSPERETMLSEWKRVLDGNANWNAPDKPSLKLASGFGNKIANKAVIEYECEITAGKNLKLDEGGKFNPIDKYESLFNERSIFLDEHLQLFKYDIKGCVKDLCDYGRVLLDPYVKGNHIYVRKCGVFDYLPVRYNERGELTAALFSDSFEKNGCSFTLFILKEWIESENIFRILYKGFRSTLNGSSGREIPLSSIPEWDGLENEYIIENVNSPLFVEMFLDERKPLCYDALDNIRQADLQYARILWEYEGGELAIDVPIDLMQADIGWSEEFRQQPNYRMPKNKERLYRNVNAKLGDSATLMNEWAPTLRDQNYWNGLNEIKRIIEFNIGASYSTISDPNQQAKTATEINALKQDNMIIVGIIQQIVRHGIEQLCNVFDTLSTVFQLAPEGHWELFQNFGDGIKEDWDSSFNKLLTLTQAGYIDESIIVSETLGVSNASHLVFSPPARHIDAAHSPTEAPLHKNTALSNSASGDKRTTQ